APPQDVLGRRDERILPSMHRNRARVARFPGENPFAADDPDDPPGQADRRSCALEHRPLLDVHLEEALRQVAPLDEGAAADTARLLFPEHDDSALADALDRLDRRDHSERAVEPAAVGDGVAVGAGPDTRLLRTADQAAGRV